MASHHHKSEGRRSMIPRHAGVIFMYPKAAVTDPEIKQFCRRIISG